VHCFLPTKGEIRPQYMVEHALLLWRGHNCAEIVFMLRSRSRCKLLKFLCVPDAFCVVGFDGFGGFSRNCSNFVLSGKFC